MFKKKMKQSEQKTSKLAFENLSANDAMDVLLSISSDIESIITDEKLQPILTKFQVPKDATGVEVNRMVIEKGAAKTSELLKYFLLYKRENVFNILAALTCENKDTYGNKTFKEMLSDIKLIMNNAEIISFFQSAGK